MILKIVFSILYISLFSACTNNKKEDPAGGPCTYETKTYAAIVIAVEKIDSLHADVLFRIENESSGLFRDSISWYMENKNWLKLSDIERNSVASGKKNKYIVDEIKTGSCDPRMERLTMEKYQ